MGLWAYPVGLFLCSYVLTTWCNMIKTEVSGWNSSEEYKKEPAGSNQVKVSFDNLPIILYKWNKSTHISGLLPLKAHVTRNMLVFKVPQALFFLLIVVLQIHQLSSHAWAELHISCTLSCVNKKWSQRQNQSRLCWAQISVRISFPPRLFYIYIYFSEACIQA